MTNPDNNNNDSKIILVYNPDHVIHDIRDREYEEKPVRVTNILKELDTTGLFRKVLFKNFSDSWINAIHTKEYISFFKKLTESLGSDETVIPSVFPVHRKTRLPKTADVQAGNYCFDADSPLNRNAYTAARTAVDCALTSAKEVLNGNRICYALVRPPGHHAESGTIGGFCYFNSTAIAANYLSKHGKVAILDLDYHHGNGQEEIFYQRPDVLTISLHGDPDFEYPYFTRFTEARGRGNGLGYNINFPLPAGTDGREYQKALRKAVNRIKKFKADFLVIALGLDTAKGDPLGTFLLNSKDFMGNGEIIAELSLPTLVVQEGGYNYGTLGINALSFFKGLL